MTKEEVAHQYLAHLQEGDMDKVISLFTKEGVVVSPIYGEMKAISFYKTLEKDTKASELHFDGLFVEKQTNRMTLLFEYRWTIKNGKTVMFKVVDVLQLDEEHKIEKLTIIYDTVDTRAALQQ